MAKSVNVPGVGNIPVDDAITGTLKTLVGVVQEFVQALSPSVMLEFTTALRDLQATIGVAFLGFVNVLSSVTREIAGVLLPLMQELEPVFRTLAEIVGDELVKVIKPVVALFLVFVPVLQIALDALQAYNRFLLDLASVVTVAIRTMSEIINAFIGGGNRDAFKETFKGFFDILRQVTKALITFAATLAVLAGQGDKIKKFADGLAKEAADRDARAGGVKAAANNPQIGDIAALVRQQQQAAFISQGGGGAREKSDTEFLKDIAKAVGDIATTKKTIGEALNDWWRTEVLGGVFGSVVRFFDNIKDGMRRFFNRVGGGG